MICYNCKKEIHLGVKFCSHCGMDIKKSEREEIKYLYHKLAHKFHPDKTSGNEEIMKKINKAYADGDLETLRTLDQDKSVENIKELVFEDQMEDKTEPVKKSNNNILFAGLIILALIIISLASSPFSDDPIQEPLATLTKTETEMAEKNTTLCNGKYWSACQFGQKFYCPPTGDAQCLQDKQKIETPNEVCKKAYGNSYYAGIITDGKYQCDCLPGYTWNNNDISKATACIKCSSTQCLWNGKCINPPANSYCVKGNTDDAWKCNEGYNEVGNSCIKKTPSEACQEKYGSGIYYNGTSCVCMDGYVWKDFAGSGCVSTALMNQKCQTEHGVGYYYYGWPLGCQTKQFMQTLN